MLRSLPFLVIALLASTAPAGAQITVSFPAGVYRRCDCGRTTRSAAGVARLARTKFFGVEVSLSQVTVSGDEKITAVLTQQEYLTGALRITSQMCSVIMKPEMKLLEVNLHVDPPARRATDATEAQSVNCPERTAREPEATIGDRSSAKWQA
jgi:hypothetical protein